ncbi:MAG: hypothetical protein KA155_07400 [Alphaproteobacteria bacterium]|jgi:hypothetical protein|nr:hypothetical protein [Alphaproteobacteria bacterium]
MEMTDIKQISDQVARAVTENLESEIDFKIALIGILGVVIGIFGNGILEWIRGYPKRALDKKRIQLLKTLLIDKKYEWREMETLSRVIGADEPETKRLLVKLGARGSEKEKDVWALIDRQPLDKTEK